MVAKLSTLFGIRNGFFFGVINDNKELASPKSASQNLPPPRYPAVVIVPFSDDQAFPENEERGNLR
jgi:hypothetical protein